MGQLGREWDGVMVVISYIDFLAHTPPANTSSTPVSTSVTDELMTLLGVSLWNFVPLTKVDTKLKKKNGCNNDRQQ